MEAIQMRFATILLALSGALALVGCDSPSLMTLDPAVTGTEAVLDATLLGRWNPARAAISVSCGAGKATLTP
jgi:hypothetical protein